MYDYADRDKGLQEFRAQTDKAFSESDIEALRQLSNIALIKGAKLNVCNDPQNTLCAAYTEIFTEIDLLFLGLEGKVEQHLLDNRGDL